MADAIKGKEVNLVELAKYLETSVFPLSLMVVARLRLDPLFVVTKLMLTVIYDISRTGIQIELKSTYLELMIVPPTTLESKHSK